MAGPNQNAILTELSSIFPQHSQQIITFIHNDVVNVYGQMADKTMILPSCIERLLELPDDFNVPTQEGNTIEQDMGVEAEIVEEMVGNDDRAILINSTINSTMNSTSTRIADVTGNSLTTTSSSNLSTNNTASTPSSSNHTTTSDDIDLDSMDTPLSSTSSENDNSFYRNKDIPRYREPVTISSGENSPVVAKDPNYFPADDIDEVLLLEDLSTDVSQVRPKILDDDDDVLEVSITVNRAKRKNENHESTPDAKKRKSSSDTSSTHNSSVNLSHVGGTIRTHVIVPNRLQDGAGPSNTTSTPNTARAGPDFTAGIFKQIEENRNNLFKNIIGASTITRPPTATIGSSTFTRPPKQQPTPKAPTPIKVPETPPPPPPPVPAPAPPVLVDIANLKKGMKDFDHYAKKRVKDIINDVAVTHIERLIQQHPDQTPLEQVVTHIITQLLEDRNYPKEQKISKNVTSSLSSMPASSSTIKSDPLFYSKQAIYELQKDFPKLKTKVLRIMFAKHKGLYTPTYKDISAILEEIKAKKKKIEDTVLEGFLKGRRSMSYSYGMQDLDPLLAKEIAEMKSEQKRSAEAADHEAAVAINNQQYEEDGQAIECGCCFMESSFDDMVQCSEGHLFCSECLRSYSKEAAFGGGKCNLVCMTSECGARFMLSQLQKALPAELLTKFQELEQNEALKLANIENLFTCPHCDFAAEVPGDGDKVFSCQNPTCLKETCMHCKEPWDDEHFGVPCKEMEKKDVTNLRKTYEEKMTEAKIRKCWQCKNSFLKESGCNKITCKCGAKMCYICRKPKIDYSHFCQHARDPGKPCTVCKQCSLWTDPKEDDDRAVKEIQKQAEEEKKKT